MSQEQIRVNTGITSKFYDRFETILIPTYSEIHRTKQCIVPEDNNAMYYWTKYLLDDELNMINELRRKSGFPKLIRLAYTGGNNYIVIRSIKERYAIEQKFFKDKPIVIEELPKIQFSYFEEDY